MRLKEWKLPLKTEDLETEELASMVKFESNSIIRFLTRDNRDILYKLDKNGRDVHYITEFKVANFSKPDGHKLKFGESTDTLK